jgi:pyruvate/2-oxoglutarate/acetoin dehydrogenase E1 component
MIPLTRSAPDLVATSVLPDDERAAPEAAEPITFLEAIREAMYEEMDRDERVFILGEDIGTFGGAFKATEGLLARFGELRVIDTPISEIGFTGAAAGAAHMGMRPIVEMQFIDFIACAYDIITNYVATSRYRGTGSQPIVIRGPSGGLVRGGPFHSQNPEAAFLHTPGLKIVYPATPSDAKGLLKAAIRDDDPVLFFEHKWLYRRPQLREVVPADHIVPLGKARIHREGSDLTIVTYAAMVHKSLDAAQILADADGLSVEVLDLRTLLPMDDEAIIASVKKTNRLLIVHEDTRTGGIAGEIAMRVNEKAFEWLDAPILRVSALDAPVPYSPPLEDYFLPQTEDIVVAARYVAGY